jgi:predicted ATPase
MAQLLDSLHLRGFLSFGPESEPVKLTGLNVLIGPNGVGKSNFIEAIELLHAAPTDFAGAIRVGGMPGDWIWHGAPECSSAKIDAVLSATERCPQLRYGIEFTESGGRLEIVNEVLEDAEAIYRGFKTMQIHREWTFGRSSALRVPQPASLPNAAMTPQAVNLGLLINELEQRLEWDRFNELMARFLPRYVRMSTQTRDGAVLAFLHEDSFRAPIPATRLSDGTLRFLTLLAVLMNAEASSLVCIEEPELGLHSDSMSVLANALVEMSAKTQIIVTTHSDALLSDLTEHAESVLVCDYGRNGTELQRVEPEKLEHWLEKYCLGDIWRMGKLGGNP